MNEFWKPIPSLDGWLACDDGRILMPPRVAAMPHGGYRTYITEPTAGCKKRSKVGARHVYLGVWTRDAGNLKIHKLICEAFHGPKPFPSAVVIHIDENALNNRADNLRWGTQKENMNAPKLREYRSATCRQKMAGIAVSRAA